MILSEPSNPYRAGVASLYTQEFYRAVRDRMTPDGMFVQWVQAYEVDGFTVNTVLTTARSVFNHVEIWQTIPGDLQVVCSQAPIVYSAAELRKRIAEPVMQEALRIAWNVQDLEGFLARFLGTAEFVDQIGSGRGLYAEHGRSQFSGIRLREDGGNGNGILRRRAARGGDERGSASSADFAAKRSIGTWSRSGGPSSTGSSTAISSPSRTATSAAAGADRGVHLFRERQVPRSARQMVDRCQPSSLSDVERLVQARAHAELGDAKCLELIAPVRNILSVGDSRHPRDLSLEAERYGTGGRGGDPGL